MGITIKTTNKEGELMENLRLVRCKGHHTNYPEHKKLWGLDMTVQFYHSFHLPVSITSLSKMPTNRCAKLNFHQGAMSTGPLIEEPIWTEHSLTLRTENMVYYFERIKENDAQH